MKDVASSWKQQHYGLDFKLGRSNLPVRHFNPLTPNVRCVGHVGTKEPVREQKKNKERTKNKRKKFKTLED